MFGQRFKDRFLGRFPAYAFLRPIIERLNFLFDVFLIAPRRVVAFREEPPERPVRVLVRPSSAMRGRRS